MEAPLESLWIGTVLGGRNAGVRGGDLEDDGRLFECEGGLGGELGGEGVMPGEDDSDFGESEFEEFELTKVLV